jgi:hypothetical protein
MSPRRSDTAHSARISALIFAAFAGGTYLIGCGNSSSDTARGAAELLVALATKTNLQQIASPTPSSTPTFTPPSQISCGSNVYTITSGTMDIVGTFPGPTPTTAYLNLSVNLNVSGPGFSASSSFTQLPTGGTTTDQTTTSNGMQCSVALALSYDATTYLAYAPAAFTTGGQSSYECIINGSKVSYDDLHSAITKLATNGCQ